MYQRFFGLHTEPFSIAPDPRFLFMSERHREALAHLRYGLGSGGGFVLLTGEIGAGKTTICRCILDQLPAHCQVAYLFNPRLTVRELLATVCTEFGIELPAQDDHPKSTKRYVDALNAHLLAAHAAGQHCVLIVDEAQRLSLALLEQLRLLTNLETNERKLLQIVLIGQPELRQMLARPELQQLAQRVVARFHLGTLSRDETPGYVRHRLAVAGMGGELAFNNTALGRVHRLSGGVPRRINLLCDRALLGAYSQGQRQVTRGTLQRAAAEVFADDDNTARWHIAGAARWLAAAGAAVALVALAWQVNGRPPWPNALSVPPGVASAVASTGGQPSGPVAQNRAASGVAAPTAGKASSPAATMASPLSPGAAIASASVSASAAPPARVSDAEFASLLLSAPSNEAEAWRQLADGWHMLDAGAEPCAALRSQGFHCYKRRANMALLRTLDRPAVLPLQTDAGAAPRYAVLQRLSAENATLSLGPHRVLVSLPTLAAHWREEIGVLWQAPPNLQINASGLPVAVDPAWLATRLAVARGAAAPGADSLPDAATLRAQTRAFQRAHGLEVDGQVGAVTLMRLQDVAAQGADRSSGMPRLRD